MLPDTLSQLTILLVLVMPGIVYAATRRWLRGPDPEDRDFSVRVLRAISVGFALDAVYLALLGPRLADLARKERVAPVSLDGLLAHPRRVAVAALVLLVAIPWLLGCATRLQLGPQDQNRNRLHRRLQLRGRVHPTPSAWDHIAPKRGACFVRIRTEAETWVGGYLSEEAFLSTYPEPRDIFIDIEYTLDEHGAFGDPVPDSLGLYVPLSGGERVAWLAVPSDEAEETP